MLTLIAQAAAGYDIDNVTFIGDTVANGVTDEKDGILTPVLNTVLDTWGATLDAATTGSLKDLTEIYKTSGDTVGYVPQGEDGVLFVQGYRHEGSTADDRVKFVNANGAYEYENYIVYVLGCDAFTKDGLGNFNDDAFGYLTDGAQVVAGQLDEIIWAASAPASRAPCSSARPFRSTPPVRPSPILFR